MGTSEVSLDGFSLISSASLGGKWRVLSMDGWYAKSLRRNRQAKSAQDGAWPSTGNVADLPITIRGQAIFPDGVTAKTAARSFMAVESRGTVDLTVTDDLGAMTRHVECDAATASPLNERLFEWSLVLTATDPLLYGAPTFTTATLAGTSAGAGLVYPLAYPLDYGVPAGVTPGAVSLANAGTASYWPRLRIDGPVPNPVVTLVESGDWVRFGGTVGAGQWLDIDLANRRVLLNGQVSVRHLVTSSGAWLAVPPGGASISWTADAADPAALLNVWGFEGAWA